MGFLQDLVPVFHKSTLTFIQKQYEADNTYSFFFKSEGSLFWKAGQHGILSFSQKLEGGSWRGFSIASHPDEGVVRIATRIPERPSAYKQSLIALQPGDKMTMRGPFGPFYLDGSRKPVVFIAGGIGITPYRALILNAAQHADQAPTFMQLLYADNTGQYAFRQELDAIAANNSFVRTEYLTSDSLPAYISEQVREQGNSAHYYISGPAKMVKFMKQSLKQQGISGKNIRHEMFLGL